MAETTVGTLDIKRLLADAAKNAATNKAARVAAKAAADRVNAKNAAERRIKDAAQSASTRAEALERQIKADLQVIKNITQGITDYSDGVPNPVALRELKGYVTRYNESIAEQQRLLKESTDLSAGKFDVNDRGQLVPKPAQQTPPSGADAAREAAAAGRAGMGGYPSSALGGTPAVAKVETTPEVKAGAKSGDKVVTNKWVQKAIIITQSGEEIAVDANGKAKDGTVPVGTTKPGSAVKGANPPKPVAGKLTAEQEARLGTFGSKFLIEYFKTAESGKYKPIYDKLVTFAIQNAQPAKVEAYLRDTSWYKDVNERTYAVIGASALANGIKLDTATRDSYRDQILGKVKTAEEIAYDIRMKSIGEYQLQTTKPEVARQMMAGKDFATAVGDYINTYTTNFEMAASQFSLEDANFQAIFKSSTSLGDFDKKLKRSDKYLSLPKVQTAISQNVAMVKQKYRQYGLNLTEEAAANLGKNAYLGDTTTEAIDENLRQQAIKLFPAFKDRILNGESVLSIASPYIGAVSRILEVPEGSLDLEDPTIRKAMMGTTATTGDKTTTTVKPLWEFEQELFKDARWQYTSNARQKLDGITLDVMGRFGVIG
jgi:hypothetical protein